MRQAPIPPLHPAPRQERSPDLATWTEIYRADFSKGVVTEVGAVTGDENAGTQVITISDPAFTLRCFWRLKVQPAP